MVIPSVMRFLILSLLAGIFSGGVSPSGLLTPLNITAGPFHPSHSYIGFSHTTGKSELSSPRSLEVSPSELTSPRSPGFSNYHSTELKIPGEGLEADDFDSSIFDVCPASCSCEYHRGNQVEAVDCSNRYLTEIPELPVTSVKVELQGNKIPDVPCTKLRHLKKLKELNLSRNMLNTLHSCSFSNLTSLERLWLTGCNLSSLPLGIFDPFQHLLEMDLSENRISEIEPKMFVNMQRLLRLELSTNRFNKIPNSTFHGLRSLDFLSLKSNQLGYVTGTFDTGAFHGLTSLKSLHIGRNTPNFPPNFTYPDHALTYLYTLENLWLDGYNLPLGRGFSALQNLTYLSFSGFCSFCSLQSLPENFFVHISTKMPLRLNLSTCFITSIHPRAFTNLPTIHTLDLYNNKNLSIDGFEKASAGLENSSLAVLNISQITHIMTGCNILKNTTFQYLKNTSLKVLLVERNRLLDIDERAIKDLPQSLEYISVHKNILQFPFPLLTLIRLRNLKIAKISQQVLHYDIRKSQHFKHVRYMCGQRRNADKIYRKTFTNPKRNFSLLLPKPKLVYGSRPATLIKMYSKHNKNGQSFCNSPDGLTEMSENKGDPGFLPFPLPAKLEVLLASQLQLPYDIPTVIFINNQVLKVVDFSNNGINCFGGPLYGLPPIQYLDLSKNFGFKLNPFFFSEMPTLLTLLLYQNRLGRSLASDTQGLTFSWLPFLETLDLSFNVIEKLPEGLFTKNENLKTLNLSNKVMSEFQLDLSNQSKLEALDLSFNSFLGFSRTSCTQFRSIKTGNSNFKINITGNKNFQCSCDNLYFLSFLLDQPNIFSDLNTFQCRLTNGTVVKYTQLPAVLPKLATQCFTLGIFVVSLVAFFLLTGALAVVSLYYYKRWQWRYLYYVGRSRLHIGSTYTNYRPVAHTFLTYDQENLRMRRLMRHQVLPRLHQMGISTVLGELDFCGAPLGPSIAGAVTSTGKTLVFLSKDIFQDFYRQTEVNLAIMHELHLRKPVLVPVLVLDLETLPVVRLRQADSSQPCSLDSTQGDGHWSRDPGIATAYEEPKDSRQTTTRDRARPTARTEGNHTGARPTARVEGNHTGARPTARTEGNHTGARPRARTEGNHTGARPTARTEGNHTGARPTARTEGNHTGARPRARTEGNHTGARPRARTEGNHTGARPTARVEGNQIGGHGHNFTSFINLVRRFPPEISVFLQGQVHRCLVYTGDTDRFWTQLRDAILE